MAWIVRGHRATAETWSNAVVSGHGHDPDECIRILARIATQNRFEVVLMHQLGFHSRELVGLISLERGGDYLALRVVRLTGSRLEDEDKHGRRQQQPHQDDGLPAECPQPVSHTT